MVDYRYDPRLIRTKADAVDDPDPNATPPATEDLLVLRPHATGLIGHLEFTVALGNSADAECWMRRGISAVWVHAGTLTGIPHVRAFSLDGIGAPVIYIRLINVSGGNPVAVYAKELPP